jgi:polyphosphate kinase
MTETKASYIIEMDSTNRFNLFKNGLFKGSADLVGQHLMRIIRENDIPINEYFSESYLLAVITEAGYSVDCGEW